MFNLYIKSGEEPPAQAFSLKSVSTMLFGQDSLETKQEKLLTAEQQVKDAEETVKIAENDVKYDLLFFFLSASTLKLWL